MTSVPDPNSKLQKGQRLDELHRSYDSDAELNQPFVILTLGACLIATMGLLADNAAVVIGAMVVAPWIMPLRTGVFAILIGDWPLLGRAMRTLAMAVLITTALSLFMGLLAGMRGLISAAGYGYFNSEILGRATPTLLDLVIALVAGALATYAKLKESVVSSLAGTAIAVALVPPVCAMGLMAAGGDIKDATGAGLLFTANLLGILVGGVLMLATLEPYFRTKLIKSRRAQLPLLVAVGFVIAITIPLYQGSELMRQDIRRVILTQRIQETVKNFLQNETLTFGSNESLIVDDIKFAWTPAKKKSVVDIVVRVTDPKIPSFKQVEAVESKVNNQIGRPLGLSFQIKVQRVQISIVEGSEAPVVTDEAQDIDLLDEDLNMIKESLERLEEESSSQDFNENAKIKPGVLKLAQPQQQ
ncbi:DUF389 domain-containing protein [Synechococcus sp. CC9616]|uniref:DUF389 domain-containing protein n=1 Tax=Synechococcus sp. CC9616 TaxID=110663 RepID=UPI00048D6AE7|nr:DUF389 domain-containing protein [Synechococcus sp. CC9616]